jgi:hypothetical protein
LLPDHDLIPVRDGGAGHRVARHPEQEQAAVTDQLPGQRIDVIDRTLSEDRAVRGDPADQRHVDGLL